MSTNIKGGGICYDCGERLTRCEECGQVYCETCEGAEHEREHRDADRECYARHAEIDREYGGQGRWTV